MDPVSRALWSIESRLSSEISLDEIAAASGVSRYHLCRAFGAATGQSVMRYVRGRRLTEAARKLAAGAPDILSLALDWGYGSHEAFTRAFRDHFGLTPEEIRARRDLTRLPLQEPIRMSTTRSTPLEEPRIERGRSILVAGLSGRYTFETASAIPALWQRFDPYFGNVPGEVGGACYGISYNADDSGFDYMAGVEVKAFEGLPAELARLRIPEQRYAVFAHRDHVSALPATFRAIWNDWLPRSGRKVSDGPAYELYDERFHPETGTGIIEVWVPLKD